MIGTLFADRYRVLSKLGEGNNPVWRAIDTHQDMEVALKTFAPGSSTIHAYAEAQTLTALEGDHVLRVFNADTSDDIPYIATRIAKLGSAEDRLLASPHGVRPDRVVTWARQALVGLGACHDRRLLHRDVKPANVFLDDEDRALLGDFGFVHAVDASGVAPAEGTPVTVAPEMWSSGRGTVTSDIYSMGVTMYRLLTGAWPFFANSQEAIARLAIAGVYTRIRDLAPQVSGRLATRVERAMKLDPADRYQTWRQMHLDLGNAGVGRVFERRAPHVGHSMCWYEVPTNLGVAHEICVIPRRATMDIEVRRATGSRTRVLRSCFQGVAPRELLIRLRAAFDRL